MTLWNCYHLGKGTDPLYLLLCQSLDMGQGGFLQQSHPCRGMTAVYFLQAALPATESIGLLTLSWDLSSISSHPQQSR